MLGRMTQIAATAPVAARPGLTRRGVVSLFQGLALALFGIPVALALLILTLLSISFIPLGIGIVTTPPLVLAVRGLANLHRRFGLHWFGTPRRPALQAQAAGRPADRPPAHLGARGPGHVAGPAVAVLGGVGGLHARLGPARAGDPGHLRLGLDVRGVAPIYDHTGGEWYGPIKVTSQLRAFGAGGLGTCFVVIGLLLAPWVMKAHAVVSKSLLAPTKEQALRRVAELTETRTAAVDASAAELRRIERDLHDGAQARLVAMGMTLGAAEHLMDSDPPRAKQLIAEARDASVTALNELRGLVRGILPPVLAERGLGDAVRALGAGLPRADRRHGDLAVPVGRPGRVRGLLRGLRDADQRGQARPATRIWIDLRHDGSLLRITVGDDGRGGADIDRGTGLAGVAKRLSTFDGRLNVASPAGRSDADHDGAPGGPK